MTVRILLFAGARAALGSNQLDLELTTPITLAEVRRHLAEAYPALQQWPAARIAVDQRYVPETYCLQGSEELAFIPPVSGG